MRLITRAAAVLATLGAATTLGLLAPQTSAPSAGPLDSVTLEHTPATGPGTQNPASVVTEHASAGSAAPHASQSPSSRRLVHHRHADLHGGTPFQLHVVNGHPRVGGHTNSPTAIDVRRLEH